MKSLSLGLFLFVCVGLFSSSSQAQSCTTYEGYRVCNGDVINYNGSTGVVTNAYNGRVDIDWVGRDHREYREFNEYREHYYRGNSLDYRDYSHQYFDRDYRNYPNRNYDYRNRGYNNDYYEYRNRNDRRPYYNDGYYYRGRDGRYYRR